MNMLALEPLIKARLDDWLSDQSPVPHVLATPDLAGVTEEKQLAPAVHVVYFGMRIKEVIAEGCKAMIEQDWLTVVVVRNVRNARRGDAARSEAGLLLAMTWSALAGWSPGAGMRRLRPASPPASAYTAGFAYHPLAWTTTLQMRGGA